VKDAFGEKIYPGTNRPISRLDAFLLMFPPEQLNAMVVMTNNNLGKERKQQVTKGELVKFLGITILMTRVKVRKRRDLWKTSSSHKYISCANFSATGMSRHRWEEIWASLRWSSQPEKRPNSMPHERWRWMLVADFVKRFNEYRATNFNPSDLICIDESMSKWYGLGGHWINMGLPMYVAMERKPVSGCEIQNACCARSRIMLRLKLVQSAEEENAHATEDESGLLHGINVMLELLDPWKSSGERIVCADSYYASVAAAVELQKHGFRFIGVVKTATKQFPMTYLSAQELTNRGDHKVLVSKDPEVVDSELLAILWVDRDRRYFVANAEGVEAAEPIYRVRWRQVNKEENAEPELVEINLEQPAAVKVYYDTAAAIDRHNRQRQDDLELERVVKTEVWWKRVNLSIFAMCVVDTCNFHQSVVHPNEIDSDPHDFYTNLAEEMIDNSLDVVATRTTRTPPALRRSRRNMEVIVSPHLTPCKERKRKKNGELTSYSHQGKCRECGMKTTYLCSVCDDKDPNRGRGKPWYCHSKNGGRDCFERHKRNDHGTR